MDAIQCIKTRKSVRQFTHETVAKEVIEDIIDCERLAPTANNVQPWEFVVVTTPEIRERIAEITDYGKFIKEAPVCIIVFSSDTKYYLEDCSAATENILLASRAYGLYGCWVAGDKKPYAEDIRKLLEVPEGYKLISLIPIGHPRGEIPNLVKRTVEDVLHCEKF